MRGMKRPRRCAREVVGVEQCVCVISDKRSEGGRSISSGSCFDCVVVGPPARRQREMKSGGSISLTRRVQPGQNEMRAMVNQGQWRRYGISGGVPDC